MTIDRTLALIPAKAGSRRLPRKNLAVVGGMSLVARAILSAAQSGSCGSIVVSTEDRDVAAEARRYGAEVPFLRPPDLARDPAGVVDVAIHALDQLEGQGRRFDTLVILLPSSPLRGCLHVREALEVFKSGGGPFVMSVVVEQHTPLQSLVVDDRGQLLPLHPEWMDRLGAKAAPGSVPKTVRSNGAITVVGVERFRKERAYYAYPLLAYEMAWEHSVDVDTAEDLALAEWVLEHRLK
jgi:CMP-N,N'-diacetyllegionaminic acid synthase